MGLNRNRVFLLVIAGLLSAMRIIAQDAQATVATDTANRLKQLSDQAATWFHQKKYDEAIQIYREILKINPSDVATWTNLGGALGNTRRYDEAVEADKKAIELAPNFAPPHANLAAAYMSLHRWDESEAEFATAIKLDPNLGQTYNAYGFLLYNMHRYPEFLAVSIKASELDPANVANFYNIGLAYLRLDRFADAATALEKTLKIAPSYKDARRQLVLAYTRLHRYKDAVDALSKLMETDPDNGDLLIDRALNYMYMGSRGEAAIDAEHFLRLYGWRVKPGAYQGILAVIGYRSVGQNDKAGAIIAQAYKKADPDVWTYKIIRYLDGQLTAEDLLAVAANTDERTEAHTYIGLDLLTKNRPIDAKGQFEWVKTYGNPRFVEYEMALGELERVR